MAYEKIIFPFKDPEEVLDYDLDWTQRLDGDTITMSTWTLSSANPDTALIIDSDEETASVTKIWLSEGTIGQTYEVTNHIITAGGREMEQTCRLRIKAK